MGIEMVMTGDLKKGLSRLNFMVVSGGLGLTKRSGGGCGSASFQEENERNCHQKNRKAKPTISHRIETSVWSG